MGSAKDFQIDASIIALPANQIEAKRLLANQRVTSERQFENQFTWRYLPCKNFILVLYGKSKFMLANLSLCILFSIV